MLQWCTEINAPRVFQKHFIAEGMFELGFEERVWVYLVEWVYLVDKWKKVKDDSMLFVPIPHWFVI